MIDKITLLVIRIFDFFHKKKIINFLKKNKNYKFNTILDIGAHKGESIELFLKHLTVNKIISFEASPLNYKILESNLHKLKKKFKKTEILIENLAAGKENNSLKINQLVESSSSTIKQINTNSNYFKKKFFFLKKNIGGNLFHTVDIKMIKLEDYLIEKKMNNIDFLKIDTEGYEYEILLGLKEKLKNVKLLMFEHHYDNMIKKNYTFNDMHELLISNNFKVIFKARMPFRKTFEYICINKVY